MQIRCVLPQVVELITKLLHPFGNLCIGRRIATRGNDQRRSAKRNNASNVIFHRSDVDVASMMQRVATSGNGLVPVIPAMSATLLVMRRRRGFSLIEITLVLMIVGLTSFAMMRQLHSTLDRMEARSAIRAAGALLGRARDEAMAQQTAVSVRIDTVSAAMDLLSRYGRITRVPLGEMHAVTLTTTRDSITYDVRGLGFGPANLTLVARRGAAAETLVVSRLGRVRY